MQYADWPDCAIAACPNKCCLRLQSKYCWPHSTGTFKEVMDSLAAEAASTEPLDVADGSIQFSPGDDDDETA